MGVQQLTIQLKMLLSHLCAILHRESTQANFMSCFIYSHRNWPKWSRSSKAMWVPKCTCTWRQRETSSCVCTSSQLPLHWSYWETMILMVTTGNRFHLHVGARCKRDSDCTGGQCCARQHGEKVCKSKLPEGALCYIPEGGLQYLLNELCPCDSGLICSEQNIKRQ